MSPGGERLRALALVGLAAGLCAGCSGRTLPDLGPPADPEPRGRFTISGPMLGYGPTVLGDCNDDRRLDVFLPASGELLVQRVDGTFTSKGALLEPQEKSPGRIDDFHVRSENHTGVFVDLDLDSREDLVVGRRTAVWLRGRDDCSFEPPQPLFQPCPHVAPQQILPIDLDQDGLLDFVSSCSGSEDPPFRFHFARGDGTYEMVQPPATPLVPRRVAFPTFATYFEDLDGDGALDGFFLADNNVAWFSWGVPGDVPSFEPDRRLTHAVSDVNGMALSPLDLDRDGRTDYFIAGASPGGNRLLWNRAPREVDDVAEFAGILGNPDDTYWSSFAGDFDFDGWSDVIVLARGPLVPELNDFAFRPPVIYLSRRNGTYADVTSAVFDRNTLFGSLMFTCGDLTSSGRIGCFVPHENRNVLVRNELQAIGGWVGVRVRGTVSAVNAYGARVSLDGESRPLIAVVGGQAPTGGLHDPGVLLATGNRAEVNLTVEWPSGIVQKLSGVPVRRYARIIEPRALEVSPRLAPADGTSRIEVVADPASIGAREARIERSGVGTWAGDATLGEDGRLRRTLVAPEQPGSARIEVRFDGKPLRVRPRIRFE